ncbi:MAG TPA: outer membrane beta-barrel protein [Verrucomicrobiota bacterium]|nr:outer membrane beta-barrel protein [Verrucomicrobiota bacterium]
MKKLIYAAGVLSVGGINLAVQAAEGGSKPWTVGLTAQGFYDDNINTAPDGPGKVGSWGAYISPSVNYAQTWDQTSLNLGAAYGAYYYADTQGTLDNDWSQTASVSIDAKHTFSPRMSLELTDTFQLFQNANQVLLGQTGRINGNNISNDGELALTVEIMPRWSVVVAYENVLFRYEEDQYASVLDRIENYGRVDLRYLMTPKTVAVAGTKIGKVNYDSGMPFNPFFPENPTLNPPADIKNNTTYFAYGGFDHSFTPNLTGSLRAGAEIQDYTEFDISTQVNPYLDVSLTYQYALNSSAQFGIIHRSNATDVTGTFDFSTDTFEPVLEQISTALYVNVKHAITGKLSGSLTASFQSSEFVGGGRYDGENEQWWSAGATVSYAFTHNLSAQVSYYYDLLNSDIPSRDYNRNRVFFGISATY